MRKYSRLHTCNLNFGGLKCVHKLHVIMIRLSIFCEKVLEIPQSKVGNFWLQGFGWHQNIWGFETSMQKRSSQIMQIGHPWNSNKKNMVIKFKEFQIILKVISSHRYVLPSQLKANEINHWTSCIASWLGRKPRGLKTSQPWNFQPQAWSPDFSTMNLQPWIFEG